MTTQARTLRRDGQSISTVLAGFSIAFVGTAALLVGLVLGGGGPNQHGGAVPPPSPISTPLPSGESASPTPAPTEMPTEVPTAEPSSAPSTPSDDGGDAMPLKVDLDNATGADVYVDIVDRTGILVGATSGQPGDGASVEPYRLQVTNIDDRTLRLTWVDYPIDNALALYVDKVDAGYRLLLIQPEPTGPTDSIAFDRELVLTFSEPVSADSVEAFLQDGLDTAG